MSKRSIRDVARLFAERVMDNDPDPETQPASRPPAERPSSTKPTEVEGMPVPGLLAGSSVLPVRSLVRAPTNTATVDVGQQVIFYTKDKERFETGHVVQAAGSVHIAGPDGLVERPIAEVFLPTQNELTQDLARLAQVLKLLDEKRDRDQATLLVGIRNIDGRFDKLSDQVSRALTPQFAWVTFFGGIVTGTAFWVGVIAVALKHCS